jgi:hypothetical protein
MSRPALDGPNSQYNDPAILAGFRQSQSKRVFKQRWHLEDISGAFRFNVHHEFGTERGPGFRPCPDRPVLVLPVGTRLVGYRRDPERPQFSR